MGILVIDDLPDSVELDRQAMAAITGGARIRAHQTMLAPRPAARLHTGAVDAAGTRMPVADAVAPPARPTLLR